MQENETVDVWAKFTLLRTGPDLSDTTTVKCQTIRNPGDSAEDNIDYALPRNESCIGLEENLSCVTFDTDQRIAVLHVIIKHDQILEGNESFHLVLHSGFKAYPDVMKVVILEATQRKMKISLCFFELTFSLSLSHTHTSHTHIHTHTHTHTTQLQ